jgi:hypothetical protein
MAARTFTAMTSLDIRPLFARALWPDIAVYAGVHDHQI